MKETLRVKDEELQQLAKELRARDSTIRELADKFTETAQAAEVAASAALAMDKERRLASIEIEQLTNDSNKKLQEIIFKLKESEEKVATFSRDREILFKKRDSALQEAYFWRSKLVKAREHDVLLEAIVVQVEERTRVSQVDAEARLKDVAEKTLFAAKEKEDLLTFVTALHSQVQGQQSFTKQVLEEKPESTSGFIKTVPMTKHADLEDDVDKACLSDSKLIRVSGDNMQLTSNGVDIRTIVIPHNPVFHGNTKHFNIKLFFLREVQKEEFVILVYCKSEDQLADLLTKSLPISKFKNLRQKLGVRRS
ncbi:uncharacterized protein LOC110035602 [Phalaenopsis equestris]|uniref:uncharacterized protein LOC110035602 n=1 Tax=Phalaenopsis equestris TaxID=78828 RepID=UPI0009E2ECB7|nr:uncharacterized protein LOC110035602 [Phalaenopsis equestris]